MTSQPLARLVQTFRDNLAADGESDTILLARLRIGRDPAAAEAIVRRHGPKVLAACRKVLGPASEAEDAFQATFLVLLRNPAVVRRSAALGAWLYGVAHRIALQARARRARRVDLPTDLPAPPELPWSEACAVLHEELDRLPDAVRLPLVLCYLDGLSRDEAAQQLGRSLNSVKKALEKGRERLRRRLARRGITLSAGLLAAVAGPVEGELSPELVASVVRGADRPAAVALAATVRPVRWPRWIGASLAAGVLAVGVAFGLSGEPRGDPPIKDMPAKPVAKVEAPAETEPKGERIAFAGRVVDPDGKAVKGAKVFLLRWGETSFGWDDDPLARSVDTTAKATTDADGRYRFEVPAKDYPDGWWRSRPQIVVTANGYGPGMIPVRPAGAVDGVVQLATDFPITGRVLNLEGKPVPGAKVSVIGLEVPAGGDLSGFVKDAEAGTPFAKKLEQAFPRGLTRFRNPVPAMPATTTDAQGKFELRGVGRDRRVTLLIEGEGLATDRVSVLTQPGPGQILPKKKQPLNVGGPRFYRPPVEYVASPEQVIEGTVTDQETGKPVADVRVWLPGTSEPTVTDRDGKYRLRGGGWGQYELTFEPLPGVPFHRREVEGGERDGGARPTRLDVALAPAVWVAGRVTDQRTGRPVPGAEVYYHPALGNTRAVVEPDPFKRRRPPPVRTGPDGTFRVRGFAGKGWIEVFHTTHVYVMACEREIQGDTTDRGPPTLIEVADGLIGGELDNGVAAIDVDPAKPKDCVVTLDPGVSATVRLTDPNGKALKGVIAFGIPRIGAWTKPTSGDTVQATAINPDRPRPFLILHPERNLGARFQPKPNDPGPWTVKLLPTATVTGRFVDADGRSIADAKVGLYAKYPWQRDTAMAWDGPEMRVKTDADGRFKLTHVIGDADSVVELLAPDRRPESASRSFHARPGEAVDLGTIKPDPPRK